MGYCPFMKATGIVVGAGSGRRLGLGEPKAFVPLGGRPILLHSIAAMEEAGEFDRVVLAVPRGRVEQARTLMAAEHPDLEARIVEGGESRQESVRRAVAAAPSDATVIVCHDAARPFASERLFRRVLAGLHGVQGVVPAIESPDTAKRVSGDRVVGTIPRSDLRLAQTPQAFLANALREAHQRAVREGWEATDDAMLLEAADLELRWVEGEPSNLKITSREDLVRAEAMLARLARDSDPVARLG